jgi:hypothetical protein
LEKLDVGAVTDYVQGLRQVTRQDRLVVTYTIIMKIDCLLLQIGCGMKRTLITYRESVMVIEFFIQMMV